MPIEASEPTTINKTYPLWAFQFQTVGYGAVPAGSPDGTPAPPVVAIVEMRKALVRADGVWELSPLESDRRQMRVGDLYATAATSPKVAAAIGALVEAVQEVAAGEGKL